MDVSKNGVEEAKIILILDIHNCMTAFDGFWSRDIGGSCDGRVLAAVKSDSIYTTQSPTTSLSSKSESLRLTVSTAMSI